MTNALTLFFVLFLCGPVVAQDLPPAILADQYQLEATEAMEKGELQKAERAFKKIEALEVEPPPMFAYFYGKLLAEHGVGPEVWRKGQSLLKQFVISAGRASEYYTPTLKLLSMVAAKLEAAEREAQREAKLKARLPELLHQLNTQMVRIEGGTFTMGCTSEQEDCWSSEKPVHQVRVSSFELSQYEVTQELWEAVMGENPSYFQHCPQCPVEAVSWTEVQAFLQKLNAGGGRYRLPSEAEWEYAARGGQRRGGYQYAGGDNPAAMAWYKENSGERTHPVGQKQANEVGLYDLSGNVSEWVQDCCNQDYVGAPSDGRAWEQGDCSCRVLRGSSWHNYAPGSFRSTIRYMFTADVRDYSTGFRIARSVD